MAGSDSIASRKRVEAQKTEERRANNAIEEVRAEVEALRRNVETIDGRWNGVNPRSQPSTYWRNAMRAILRSGNGASV